MNDIKRGEMFYISRGGASYNGSEQHSDRPAVVVSNNKNNENSNVIEIVYMTTQPKTDLPTHVTVRSTGRISTVLCEQVYSVSTERVGTYIGECTDKEMENIDIALMISLQLDGNMKTSKKYNETIKEQLFINAKATDAKFDYYMEAYDDDLILIAAKDKKDIRITAAGQGNRFEDIECQLLGERGKGWKELIAGAIDNAYEKMIATTPPTTEEEQTHCEMIKEAVKGMFINESRTAAEAEFIKTHIVDYEKIFDVCMNGDDLEFKKGLVRLQKMQNEYVMQREND